MVRAYWSGCYARNLQENPALHVVDISENNMVELVRILEALGYIDGDFRLAIDCGSNEYEALMNSSGGYNYAQPLSS